MTETAAALQQLATAVARLRQAETAAATAIGAIGHDDERVVSMSAVDVQAAIRRGKQLAALRGSA